MTADDNDLHSTVLARSEFTCVPGRRLRLWFGAHVIATYDAEQALAERYVRAMTARFAGLQVTNEQRPPQSGDAAELPVEPLWPLTAL